MGDEVGLKHIFQFGLVVLGLLVLLLTKTNPESAITTLLKYLLVILGVVYVVYKFAATESTLKKVFIVASMVLAGIVLLILSFQNNIGECNASKPCGENQLCGADQLCHDVPEYTSVITKVTVEREVSLTLGGIIIGLGIIISAIILRNTSFYTRIGRFFRR
ncbi:hypothetical protein J4457_00585 [Candidatus Woesearchaeota archaeon]|nr:hypothetical protein [Candidatus Woesearchaeota archaeon]